MATKDRKAKISIESSAAGMDRGLNDARRKMRSFEREQDRRERQQERDGNRRQKRVGNGVAGGVGKLAMFAAGVAGIDIGASLVTDVLDVNRELLRMQIDAQASAATMAAFSAETMKVSNATGVARLELVKGAHAYQVLTGDAEGAMKVQQLFAEVANATGTHMEDIAAVAASMKKNMGFDEKDFRKGFDVLVNMGHRGTVELRDFAGELSGLAPQFKDFGDKGTVDKWTEMAAVMQGVKNNFADASETATGFRALMNAISKDKVDQKLAAYGVKVWRIDPKTKEHVKRDFLDIMKDIISNKSLDAKALQEVLGGRQEALRAMLAIRDHWQEIADLKEQASNTDQVAKDNATYMQSTTAKLARAWETIKNAIATALTPERVEMFANAMMRVAQFTMDAVGAVEHMLGNDKPSDRSNVNAQGRLDAAGEGIGDSPIRRQAEARQLYLADQLLASGAPGTAEGDAAIAGAIKYHKAQGRSVSDISAIPGVGIGADWSFQPGAYNPMKSTYASAGVTPADFQKLRDMIVAGVREGFQGASVNIDGTKVATAAADGKNQRNGLPGSQH